ncbi:hypothetical protein F5J12DRAFT_454549 [Pisolithus orientalis]|uniref:uncharacterized protein n=1 Tax=Pisolithus orientalis TaxID=936130 RepID=UPI0022256B2F|nr:uncharacterized protein F5J12DRAFT_454549 [Pisolithus orientalis]KAI6025914.1 hypothetical protein F5J12DRAFT_454549 [Pisolithus orientalis]
MLLPLPRLLLTVLALATCTSFVNFATFSCEMKSTVRNAYPPRDISTTHGNIRMEWFQCRDPWFFCSCPTHEISFLPPGTVTFFTICLDAPDRMRMLQ